MIQIRKADERGHFDHGRLNTYHTFSFADYYDPDHIHFRTLRIMNEERVLPGQGFGYVLQGALQHRDSLANGSIIRAGQLQRMTAGTGVRPSEFNPWNREAVHFYQIWILPVRKGLPPAYEERTFHGEQQPGHWRLVASPDGAEGSLTIHQDAFLYLTALSPGQLVDHAIKAGRAAWLQVLRGKVTCQGNDLSEGDGATITDVDGIGVQASDKAEILLFDLPCDRLPNLACCGYGLDVPITV
jgi:quercetin 2,3-dioxygenase